jgi:hypothetical protein
VLYCAVQPCISIGAALKGFDSEDMEDLIAELEKDETFTMDVRMLFEETAAALKKEATAAGAD